MSEVDVDDRVYCLMRKILLNTIVETKTKTKRVEERE